MKFERLLQVYWLKGFLYGGDIVPFETPLARLFNEFGGISSYSFLNIIKKLEISAELKSNPLCVELVEEKTWTINVYLAQVASVNIPVFDLEHVTTVRYYLIKSYRGRCQARGKPANGQRTWSNAKTAATLSNPIRTYISKFKKTHIQPEIIKKINFKVTQRKAPKASSKLIKKVVKKPATLWL